MYHKAAGNDHIKAQYNLALSYEKGEGKEKILEKAFKRPQKMVILQHNGCLYYKGEGSEKDLERTSYWYR